MSFSTTTSKTPVHARSVLLEGTDWKDLVKRAVDEVNRDAPPQAASFAILFITPNFKDNFEEIIEQIRFGTRAVHLIGCSAAGLIGNNREIEGRSGLSLITMRLPDTVLFAHYFEAQNLDEEHTPAYWHGQTGVAPDQMSGWILFGDPFNTPCDRLISHLNAA